MAMVVLVSLALLAFFLLCFILSPTPEVEVVGPYLDIDIRGLVRPGSLRNSVRDDTPGLLFVGSVVYPGEEMT